MADDCTHNEHELIDQLPLAPTLYTHLLNLILNVFHVNKSDREKTICSTRVVFSDCIPESHCSSKAMADRETEVCRIVSTVTSTCATQSGEEFAAQRYLSIGCPRFFSFARLYAVSREKDTVIHPRLCYLLHD